MSAEQWNHRTPADDEDFQEAEADNSAPAERDEAAATDQTADQPGDPLVREFSGQLAEQNADLLDELRLMHDDPDNAPPASWTEQPAGPDAQTIWTTAQQSLKNRFDRADIEPADVVAATERLAQTMGAQAGESRPADAARHRLAGAILTSNEADFRGALGQLGELALEARLNRGDDDSPWDGERVLQGADEAAQRLAEAMPSRFAHLAEAGADHPVDELLFASGPSLQKSLEEADQTADPTAARLNVFRQPADRLGSDVRAVALAMRRALGSTSDDLQLSPAERRSAAQQLAEMATEPLRRLAAQQDNHATRQADEQADGIAERIRDGLTDPDSEETLCRALATTAIHEANVLRAHAQPAEAFKPGLIPADADVWAGIRPARTTRPARRRTARPAPSARESAEAETTAAAMLASQRYS